MDVTELNQEVKEFKKTASLKRTTTEVKNRMPTQEGVCANAFLLTLFMYIFNGDFFFLLIWFKRKKTYY